MDLKEILQREMITTEMEETILIEAVMTTEIDLTLNKAAVDTIISPVLEVRLENQDQDLEATVKVATDTPEVVIIKTEADSEVEEISETIEDQTSETKREVTDPSITEKTMTQEEAEALIMEAEIQRDLSSLQAIREITNSKKEAIAEMVEEDNRLQAIEIEAITSIETEET